jgi:hypothetical protein
VATKTGSIANQNKNIIQAKFLLKKSHKVTIVGSIGQV